MSDHLEIQREAIIEVVGTQYDDRQPNHAHLQLQQKLVMQHQKNNPYDANAMQILTEDGKDLGFLPKGYASLYAPAMDSQKYSFTVEVVKTEPDPERPILIVKIVSEYVELQDDEIEQSILSFVKSLEDNCRLSKENYLALIYAPKVETTNLLSCFYLARMYHQLLTLAEEGGFCKDAASVPAMELALGKTATDQYLNRMQTAVNEVLKRLQKAYNESLDIDDEDEYYRLQNEIRNKRKRFRAMRDFCEACCKVIEGSEIQEADKTAVTELAQESVQTVEVREPSEPATQDVPESVAQHSDAPKKQDLSEEAFMEWLVRKKGFAHSSAKQYCSTIHNIERLYQKLFGKPFRILGADSTEAVEKQLKELLAHQEYQKANLQRGRVYNNTLKKYADFVGISTDEEKNTTKIADDTTKQATSSLQAVAASCGTDWRRHLHPFSEG